MNPISAFFVRNIIIVFFFYGLTFFVMGLALLLASRRQSEFRFAAAIRPLAAFGILHGLHEWFEMYQKYAALTGGYTPSVRDESLRLLLLGASFVALLIFGVALLNPADRNPRRRYLPLLGMVALWGLGAITVALRFQLTEMDLVAVADVLARYSLGIPGALLGTWALMAQQRTFREHNMPQFGRDLVWCAAALFLFGAVGQIFVRPTLLTPTQWLNSTLFLQWFGIPVQLFRAVMAAVMTFYMVHALRAFEVENGRRLEQALLAERRNRREVERLNSELRLTARELSLLLGLSNDLSAPTTLQERLSSVLTEIVRSLAFPDKGMILLTGGERQGIDVRAITGFGDDVSDPRYALARRLGEQSISSACAVCIHEDGQIIEFSLEAVVIGQQCWQHASPTTIIGLPLQSRQGITGSLVLARPEDEQRPLPLEELQLMAGIARQLTLSIENARLTWRAQRHEKLLADLLDQVVDAQEAERTRIARELHDATGQSLTAISLGLRGIGRLVEEQAPSVAAQLREVESYSTSALTELRRIIADLRPSQLDDLGLVAALRWYVQAYQQRRGIEAEFILHGEPARLPAETETVLFRITQEALTNVAKHAEATRVTVSLETEPTQVAVTIADNGRGFDPDNVLQNERPHTSGWGLLGIRERTRLLGGVCAIQSTPEQGSRIRVTIPLKKEKADVEDTALVG
ncbi:MAG: GAF domain-containing sensor histidine kinase [Caldilineaceae bacterium]|nr:GAF domain-containing sensor histidine kinase [Caldilineaceae bacterium]